MIINTNKYEESFLAAVSGNEHLVMKLFVVLVASIALCTGNLLIPGDNNDYVEGESRYIWIPDGDDIPRLVDLQESVDEATINTRNGADNQYWLYTRHNPNTPQFLFLGDYNSVAQSNYVASRPTKVVVHGWNSNGNSNINPAIVTALLTVGDYNVIVVDWRRVANWGYLSAARGVPEVGRYLGYFMIWLVSSTGASWSDVHMIGFSLGAHVIGNAGRTADGKPARLTGLDPAGPIWGGNDDALKASDAAYVEAIHTDGGRLGIMDPIAQVNFYPNGGRNAQPGCWVSTCSHSRAYSLYAATVVYNHLEAKECATLDEARRVRCNGERTMLMGNALLPKHGHNEGTGLFGLTTGRNWPF